MRRLLFVGALVMAVGALAVPAALADSPHFIGTPSCTKNADFSLTCSGKASGLGSTPISAYVTSTNVSGNIQCQNNGGNFPAPKNYDFGPLTGPTTNITPHNGQITFSVSVGPPTLPSASDLCPNGKKWTVVILSLTYKNVQLFLDDTSGNHLLQYNFGDIDP
jgi:hypothetical protein